MCQLCVDALNATFPDVPTNEAVDFIMSVTAYPMAEPETIKRQLEELRAQTSNYQDCYGIVARVMDDVPRD